MVLLVFRANSSFLSFGREVAKSEPIAGQKGSLQLVLVLPLNCALLRLSCCSLTLALEECISVPRREVVVDTVLPFPVPNPA
jgi:hypothetical protein